MNKSIIDFICVKTGPRIIACCGSGGVGKTTISAAIGLQCALSGQKTLVLTIDPARRLADSLGISSIKYEEQRVPKDKFEQFGLKPSGELFAMMLDTKRTFDHLVGRYASDDMQQKILKNRYYQHLSTTMAGSHEYIAMEKLYEIYYQNKFDIIVLDTPPSRRALDFLEQPQRITDLLSHNFFWKFFKPYVNAGKLGLRMLNAVAAPILKVTKQVMGAQVLNDVTEFFNLWDDVLFDGFRQRAEAAKKLLSSEETLFVAITSPMKATMQEALFLYNKLKKNNIPFGGFIINRVYTLYPNNFDIDELFKDNSEIKDQLKRKLISNFNNFIQLAKKDDLAINDLQKKVGQNIEILKIPYFENDVYDFGGLIKVNNKLFNNKK